MKLCLGMCGWIWGHSLPCPGSARQSHSLPCMGSVRQSWPWSVFDQTRLVLLAPGRFSTPLSWFLLPNGLQTSTLSVHLSLTFKTEPFTVKWYKPMVLKEKSRVKIDTHLKVNLFYLNPSNTPFTIYPSIPSVSSQRDLHTWIDKQFPSYTDHSSLHVLFSCL